MELHGNVNIEKCPLCNKEFLRDYTIIKQIDSIWHRTGRICNEKGCGGKLKDTVISKGEVLRESKLKKAIKIVEHCDLLIVLGSSLQEHPAKILMDCERKNDENLVIVNLQATEYDLLSKINLNGYVDDVMERLMSRLQLTIPKFTLNRWVKVELVNLKAQLI